jgi:hypothetical protein
VFEVAALLARSPDSPGDIPDSQEARNEPHQRKGELNHGCSLLSYGFCLGLAKVSQAKSFYPDNFPQ